MGSPRDTSAALPDGLPADAERLGKVLDQRPVLWVGAGASIAAGYPSTARLVAAMIAAADEPDRFSAAMDFTEVADEFIRQLGAGALGDLLQRQLGPPGDPVAWRRSDRGQQDTAGTEEAMVAAGPLRREVHPQGLRSAAGAEVDPQRAYPVNAAAGRGMDRAGHRPVALEDVNFVAVVDLDRGAAPRGRGRRSAAERPIDCGHRPGDGPDRRV